MVVWGPTGTGGSQEDGPGGSDGRRHDEGEGGIHKYHLFFSPFKKTLLPFSLDRVSRGMKNHVRKRVII